MPDLRVFEAEPLGTDIIETLEAVLERARAGEFSSIAIAYVYRDGCIGSRSSSAPSRPLLLGSVARLSYLLAQDMDG
jgi:hypothetical protein